MTKEWMKQFIDLVKSGAQFKAYQRYLGLDRAGVKAHLGKLPEYEKALEEKVKPLPFRVRPPGSKRVIEKVVVTEEELNEKLTGETSEAEREGKFDEICKEDENL